MIVTDIDHIYGVYNSPQIQAGAQVQRYRKRTPAMAVGWTRHRWSEAEFNVMTQCRWGYCRCRIDARVLAAGAQADLSIFGLQDQIDVQFMAELTQKVHSTCILVHDSGRESALA